MSRLSQNERDALSDIFTVINTKETLISKFFAKKSELIRFLKLFFVRHKKSSNHPVR